jgi:polyisoprenoid-binding protein YceI
MATTYGSFMTPRFANRTLKRLRHLLVAALLACTTSALAQSYVFELDPHQSQVAFTLDDVLHTVHGSFQLKAGSIRFVPSAGAVSGLLVVDATSGDSGSKARDRKMHKDILESEKFPEISFAPQRILGQVVLEGKSQITIEGVMTLHGQPHPMSILAPVEVHAGRATADLTFLVPYVQWGLKNPSTFILRVSDKVKIDVRAVGYLVAEK